MNRMALLVAVGYLGLGLVAAVMYASTVAKFVDYSQTIFELGEPGRVRVEQANATQEAGTGNWTITVRWRFENAGRLPIALGSFRFDLHVDNRSDPAPYYEPSKLANEYHGEGSWYLPRFAAPVIAPGGSYERGWTFNATGADAAKIVPDNGKVWILFTGADIVFYVADTESFQEFSPPDAYLGV